MGKKNHKEHIYLKLQTDLDNETTESIVLVNRDQTQLITDDLFFNSEDHNFLETFPKTSKNFNQYNYLLVFLTKKRRKNKVHLEIVL